SDPGQDDAQSKLSPHFTMNTALRLRLGLPAHHALLHPRSYATPTAAKQLLGTDSRLKKRTVNNLEVFTDGSRRLFGVGGAARADTPLGTIVMKEYLGQYSDHRSLDAEFLGAILGLRIIKTVAAQSRYKVALSATVFMDCDGAISKLVLPDRRKERDALLTRRFDEEMKSLEKTGVLGNELVDLDAAAAAYGETSTSLSVAHP
ncbi:hypothetical protein C8F01DRAFT_1106899, partial [Mycena amicta]